MHSALLVRTALFCNIQASDTCGQKKFVFLERTLPRAVRGTLITPLPVPFSCKRSNKNNFARETETRTEQEKQIWTRDPPSRLAKFGNDKSGTSCNVGVTKRTVDTNTKQSDAVGAHVCRATFLNMNDTPTHTTRSAMRQSGFSVLDPQGD